MMFILWKLGRRANRTSIEQEVVPTPSPTQSVAEVGIVIAETLSGGNISNKTSGSGSKGKKKA